MDADGDAVGWPLGPGWLARWSRMAGRLVPVGCPVGPAWLAGWSLLVSRLVPGGWLVSPGCFGRSVRAGWLVGPGWLLLYLLVFGLVLPCLFVFCSGSMLRARRPPFSFIPSRRPQNTDYERTNLRIPLRSRLYPSRPYPIEVTLLPL